MKFIRYKDFYLLIIMGLIKIVSYSPLPKLKEIVVRSLVFAFYRCSRNKRRVSEKRVLEAFSGKFNEKERRQIIKSVFYEFWRDTFLLLPSATERAAYKKVPIRGLEHLQGALNKGKGVILWESNSFGRRVFSKQILRESGLLLHQVYGTNHLVGFLSSLESWVRNHIIRPTFARWEKQFLAEILYLPRSDSLVFTRTLLSRLKQNGIICIPGDGKSGLKMIPVEFLGRSDLFSTGMVSLARISGASILPMLCFDEGNGETCLIIEPPIPIESKVDRDCEFEGSITQYANLLESYVRRYPEQYQNWHFFQG